jgi:hypothetical protein
METRRMGKCELSAHENYANTVTRTAHFIFYIHNFRRFLTENTVGVHDKEQQLMPYLLWERYETYKQTLWQDAIS